MVVGLIYSDEFLKYDFGRHHPLNQTRLRLAFAMMRAYGLTDDKDVKVFEPPMAKEDDLFLAHDREYVGYVKRLSSDPGRARQLHGFGPGDNPPFEGVYEGAAVHVGGTIRACELVMKGEVDHAFSIGGGYHHALEDRASGFCVFNDPAIAIRKLQKDHGLKRVLYIDIDAHHGDGVQWIFYDDPSVMTISLHESGRFLFPGSGFIEEDGKDVAKGTKINVPLPMGTGDKAYLYAFREGVIPIIRAFKPEFMLCQCGGDAHFSDPLTHLSLTTRSYGWMAHAYHDLAHELMGGKWACVTGGGYDINACARIWTLMFSEMAGRKLDDRIPESYWKEFKGIADSRPSKTLEDADSPEEDEYLLDSVKDVVREMKGHFGQYYSLGGRGKD